MKKPHFLLPVVLIIALLLSIKFVYHRYEFERKNHAVEMVMSYRDLSRLALMGGNDRQTVLMQLKSEAGLTSIALEEDTIEDLVNAGQITLIPGADILNMARVGGGSAAIKSTRIHADRQYVVVEDKSLYERISKTLSLELGKANVSPMTSTILEVMCEQDVLVKMGIGLNREAVAQIREAGCYVIPRLKSTRRLSSDLIQFKLRSIASASNANTVIFEGDTVLGYPSQLGLVSDRLLAAGMNLGYVEFIKQDGLSALAKKMPRSVIRVHSILEPEEERLTESQAIDRYMRAVKERGVRIVFLRPFFEYPGEQNIVDYNAMYFAKIHRHLEKMGYAVVPIRYLPVRGYAPISPWETGVIGLGVMTLLIWLLRQFYPISTRHVAWIFAGNVAVFAAAVFFHMRIGYQQFLALISVLSGSTLALLLPFPQSELPSMSLLQKARFATQCILKGSLVALMGVVFVVALLSDVSYLVSVQQFSGVKLAFLVPLLLIGVFFYLRPSRMRSAVYVVRRVLYSPVRTGTLLAVFVSLLVVVIYVLRSGNEFHLEVPFFETWARNGLEKFLFVRPRTKEFLIGYPVLFLAYVYVDTLISRAWLWFCMILGIVGYVSMVNSFCHIHTPLVISLYRGILGLIIGCLVGLVAMGIIELLRKWKKTT